MVMNRYIHTARCMKSSELSTLLREIHPEELVEVTEGKGYTVIWKSDTERDERTMLTMKNWTKRMNRQYNNDCKRG